MIIRVHPPKSDYWSVEFGSFWWETLDYRYRLCSTNCEHAVIEDNGELIMIVSHEDPGIPNWLDPSGHNEGYITFRWIGCELNPKPVVTLIKSASLERNLPDGVRTISANERKNQIESRRKGVLKRFKM